MAEKNDYIKREDALNCVNGYFLTGLHKAIQNIPSADVVAIDEESYEVGYTAGQMAERKRIVHCKDCKYWLSEDDGTIHVCEITEAVTNADDFCSYGERLEE